MVYPGIQKSIYAFSLNAEKIAPERKDILDDIVGKLNPLKEREELNLQFICTHNSRRSIFGQVWGQAIAQYLGMENVHCFSGGTMATAVYPMVLETLTSQGFRINQLSEGENPEYEIMYSDEKESLKGKSKVYSSALNPEEFVAIMTCSDAERNCPYIPQAELRLSLKYDDPKRYDGQPVQAEKYLERSKQIGTEMFYIFNKLSEK